ncbi:hypothetical protein As57867_004396, partial [Aphanomyces stellatus]
FLEGNKDGERIEIVKRTVHPKYDAKTYDYDFAVFELKSASKYAPVKITWDNDQYVAPGVTSWVRGFGTTSSGGSQSPVLLEAPVDIWANDKCGAAFTSYNLKVTDRMLCAGGGFKDTCQGDSGGPLTVVKNGEEHLAALTSWGIGCASPGLPGVYSRISSVRDFIEPFLGKPAC